MSIKCDCVLRWPPHAYRNSPPLSGLETGNECQKDTHWRSYFSKHKRYYAVAAANADDEHYDITQSEADEQCHIESWDFTDSSSCCPKNTLIQASMDSKPTKQFTSNPQGWRIRDKDVNKRAIGSTRRYLVEDSSGNLLLVLRFVATMVDKDGFLVTYDKGCTKSDYEEEKDDILNPFADEEKSYITVGFAVYKLDWTENKWDPVESIGDKALFVGLNHLFAVSTHEFPDDVKENSIYFTDDSFCRLGCLCRHTGGHDVGVYNMENASISGIFPSALRRIQQLPVWFLPKVFN